MDLSEFVRNVSREPARKPDPVLDAAEVIDSAAAHHFAQSIRLDAAGKMQVWAETADEDLDSGETLADRFLALVYDAVGDNSDDDDSEDLTDMDAYIIGETLDAAAEYLESTGVSDEDISALFDDWSSDAAIRVRDAFAENLPDEDEANAHMIRFAFAPVLDNESGGGTYRRVLAISDGKKVRGGRNVRISGKRRRKFTRAQKDALIAARKKAHYPYSEMKRMKSMDVRSRMGVANKRKFI